MMKLVRMGHVGICVSKIDECYIKYHLSTSYQSNHINLKLIVSVEFFENIFDNQD